MNDNYNHYCTHCGVELNFDDHYDMYDDGDRIIVKAIGCCPNCRKNFRWEDVYVLQCFQELEEVDHEFYP